MAKINVKDMLNIGGAVIDALQNQADKSSNKMTDKDVNAVAPVVTKEVEAQVKKDIQPVIDVVSNQEPFYMSIQWWTQMMGIAVAAAGLVGYAIPEDIQKETLALISGLIGVATAGAMFYNRYIRSSALLRRLGGDTKAGTGS